MNGKTSDREEQETFFLNLGHHVVNVDIIFQKDVIHEINAIDVSDCVKGIRIKNDRF